MPSPELIDSNLIIRFVANDHPDHSPRAQRFLEALAVPREQETTITEGVLVEITQVLSSPRLYNLAREHIAQILTDIVSLPGLTLPQRETYLHALNLYGESRVDFVDALNAAHAHRLGGIVVSFDRDYDRMPGVRRVEP